MSDDQTSARGGARDGAGRPKGKPTLRRAAEAIAAVAEAHPGWSPVLHFAAVANDKDLPVEIRLDAAKAAAPYLHARPKTVELDPDALVELEGRLIRAKLDAVAQASEVVPGLGERLERAMRRAAANAAMEMAENPQLMDAAPTVEHRPSPTTQAAPAPKPAASAPPVAPAPFVDYYRPVLPRSSSSGVDFVECEYDPTGGSYDLP